jgi:branched-subunit amino acid aminotransferase/4-amino-4-deoxychorismate lyase
MPKPIIYINGDTVKENSPVILAKDPGLLSGYGVYDSIRVYRYRPFKLPEHVSRLKGALHTIDIDIPATSTWEEDIDKYLQEAELEDGVLRITVTSGINQPNILFTHRPIGYTASMYQDGYTLMTSSIRRNDSSPMTYIKSVQLMDGVLAKRDAIRAGFHDALFLNTKNQITECSTSNLFFVCGQTLYTPEISCGLLNGIARELIISHLAGELKYSVVEGAFTCEDLYRADEVFISNSVIQIMPVTRVDEHIIGDGKPGPIARRVAMQYEKHVRDFVTHE